MNQLIERFQEMPRAMRWAVMAGVGILLFLFWSDFVMVKTQELNDRADRIETHLRAVHEDRFENEIFGLADAIRTYGDVDPPREGDGADAALNARVNDVLARYNSVREKTLNLKAPNALRKNTIDELLKPGQSAQRSVVEVNFVCSDSDALSIIADLEASPEVEAINSLRLTKIAGRNQMRVQLSIEAWMITDSGRV